jgi:hypothetical protein
MADAPALAKDKAIDAPIPVPPPLITTTFPLAESSGHVWKMDGVGEVFQVLVKVGKKSGFWLVILSRFWSDVKRYGKGFNEERRNPFKRLND